MSDEETIVTVRKVGTEWCAFLPDGRELARAKDRLLLTAYLTDAGVTVDTPH